MDLRNGLSPKRNSRKTPTKTSIQKVASNAKALDGEKGDKDKIEIADWFGWTMMLSVVIISAISYYYASLGSSTPQVITYPQHPRLHMLLKLIHSFLGY